LCYHIRISNSHITKLLIFNRNNARSQTKYIILRKKKHLHAITFLLIHLKQEIHTVNGYNTQNKVTELRKMSW